MAKRTFIVGSSKRKDSTQPKKIKRPKLGPSWMYAEEVLENIKKEIPNAEDAVSILIDTLVNGKANVFTNGLEWIKPDPARDIYINEDDDDDIYHVIDDGWDIKRDTPNNRAVRLGMINSELDGPTEKTFALTENFWKSSDDLLKDMNNWNWKTKFFITLNRDYSDKFNRASIKLDELIFYTLHVHAMIVSHKRSLIESSQKGQNQGGRPRTNIWDNWTAYLVTYFHENGIPSGADPDDIARAIDSQMGQKGLAKVDHNTAVRIITVVQKKMLSLLGKLTGPH